MNHARGKNLKTILGVSGFEKRLRYCNGLDASGFETWAFLPAMLFGSRSKWWGTQGKRDRPHEGLDLCLYRTKERKIRHLGKNTKVPVIFEGEIVKVEDDYLGKSMFMSHGFYDSQGSRLHTIYGHIKPYNFMHVGKELSGDDIIGTIADARKSTGAVPSHIHISVAWIPNTLCSQDLNWKVLADLSIVTLLDPLSVIICPYSIVDSI
ncbi:hypothetical protein ACFLVM_01640 [Chloroflexota bacterium]